MNKQEAIQKYSRQIKALEELIEEFGINRSLGNVLTNIKAKKFYWDNK